MKRKRGEYRVEGKVFIIEREVMGREKKWRKGKHTKRWYEESRIKGKKRNIIRTFGE